MYDRIEEFLYNLLAGLKFMYRTFRRENIVNYITKDSLTGNRTEELLVFANGPSLSDVLGEIKSGKFARNDSDIIMMNFTANSDDFYKLKPKYFCISDIMFYRMDKYREDKVRLLFDNLNSRVDWPLNVYFPYRWYKDKKFLDRFHNPHLNPVPFHTLEYQGFERFRFPLMIRNIGGSDFGTVLQNAINIGIILGYKKLYLYGADHTFFDGLMVDDNNQVCKITSHVYEEDGAAEPIYQYYSGEKLPYTMSFFLSEYARLFAGHEIMKKYADFAGAEIINMTKNSMINSYRRGFVDGKTDL